ncbi:glycosyl transferase, putative [Indibacter alkaliphilus LW1]|uniref:Glycosyl transferase, putative n=1 Tax=Indibacter alkaliphilus (strain CCUG 57479 / KCTC 22604 / LW1) TaxID=1189612 RepID=S2DV70_INDAL|nr:glycosyl transferase, putative [Indibacter alkaliphilus LW1]
MKQQQLASDLFEVIVVNNDPEIPLELPKDFYANYSLILFEEPRPGSYAARNKGIAHANGEILAFTDSDCLPDTNWLSNALEIFDRDTQKKLGILTGPVPLFYKDPKKLTAAEVYEKYTGFTTEAYAKEGHAITANWFSYRNTLLAFKGFDENLKSNGDSDLSKKITDQYEIQYSPNVIVRHPSRYFVSEVVYKYRRVLGGTYQRKFKKSRFKFLGYLLDFTWRRVRFSAKKMVTIRPKESSQILVVNLAIVWGTWKEFFYLLNGLETKR